MAQILVPGVASAVLSGVYFSQPWAVVWHFKYDGNTSNWTQTEIQGLADSLSGQWLAHAGNETATAVHLTQVQTTDIGSATPTVGINTAVRAGGGVTPIENSSVCALMSFHIAARYKGGHPRSYLPWGGTQSLASEFQWTQAFQTSANAAIAALIGGVRSDMPPRGSSQVSHVVPRYTYQVVNDPVHQKYVRQRTGLKSVDVVQAYSLNPTFGIQRRRLRA